MLQAYLAGFPAEPMGAVQIFCTSLQPTLFQRHPGRRLPATCSPRCLAARGGVSWPTLRQSGATEALAGDVPPEKLSSKSQHALASNRRHRTYAPVQLAAVRDTDEARQAGRRKLRERNRGEKFPSAGQGVPECCLAKS